MAKRLKSATVVYKGAYATRVDIVEGNRLMPVNININGTVVPVNANISVYTKREVQVPVLVTLRLKKGTRVNRWSTRMDVKLRSDGAEVGSIVDREGRRYGEAHAKRDRFFKYYAGEAVKPVFSFDPSDIECSHGIHFFRGIEKAWAWVEK